MIGVFDSGLGGLTVVRELQERLPAATVLYVGDSLHAPYGPRTVVEIQAFSLGLTRWLQGRGCTVVVVACNTATAVAVPLLRKTFPELPIVGMEPAIKPAAACTKTRRVGVLATEGTLQSARFADLRARYGGGVHFYTVACPGWVEVVEAGELATPETRTLVARYLQPLLDKGVDTVVLGCTHFPVLRPLIAELAGPEITLLDTGEAVARRVASLVDEPVGDARLLLYTTGDTRRFATGAATILAGDIPPVGALYWSHGELIEYAKS